MAAVTTVGTGYCSHLPHGAALVRSSGSFNTSLLYLLNVAAGANMPRAQCHSCSELTGLLSYRLHSGASPEPAITGCCINISMYSQTMTVGQNWQILGYTGEHRAQIDVERTVISCSILTRYGLAHGLLELQWRTCIIASAFFDIPAVFL